MNLGDVFRRSWSFHKVCIVISDPRQDPINVVVVTCTSASFDRSCILTKAECLPLQHDSYISYQHSKIWADADLEKDLAAGGLTITHTLDAAALKKIHDGAAISQHLATGHHQILDAQGLLP